MFGHAIPTVDSAKQMVAKSMRRDIAHIQTAFKSVAHFRTIVPMLEGPIELVKRFEGATPKI